MKKYLQLISVLGIFFTGVFLKNFIKHDDELPHVIQPTRTPIPTALPSQTTQSTPPPENSPAEISVKATPTTHPSPVPATPTSSEGFKNGSYTGSVEDAYYGYIQVKAVITGGKLSDIEFLQYPNDNHTSLRINEQALPILKSEALDSQGKQIDLVSGASVVFNFFT